MTASLSRARLSPSHDAYSSTAGAPAALSGALENVCVWTMDKKKKSAAAHAHTAASSAHAHRALPAIGALLCAGAAALGLLLSPPSHPSTPSPAASPPRTYAVYSAQSDVHNKQGLLKHVHNVLHRLGYDTVANDSAWSLLWSHDYPFRALHPHLHRLTPHQKVNHFPGTGFITNKVDFATIDSRYIPKAFKLPRDREALLQHAAQHPDAWFLEKHNQHRGVRVRSAAAVDARGGAFAQECVRAPLLVDGHKFDVGVYVLLTSVDPLRVYWYKGDVLFRYCPEKYYPFDPENLDKYVVADDYRPTWEVPALRRAYDTLGHGMKDSFDVYLREQGKDPELVWAEVEVAIAEIFLKKEHHIVEALKSYPRQSNFFELMRFDLVLDEEARVHLLEANMSPNLSSAHFPPNQLLYEQLLYSLFGITGVGSALVRDRELNETTAMLAAQKNVAVFGSECARCDGCGGVCALCQPCVRGRTRLAFEEAYREFMHRGDFKRLFPPSMKPGKIDEEAIKDLTESNRLHYMWVQGKCNADAAWCSS